MTFLSVDASWRPGADYITLQPKMGYCRLRVLPNLELTIFC